MGKIKKGLMVSVACVAVAAVGAVMVGAVNIGGNKEDEPAQEVDTRVMVSASAPVRGNIVVTGEFIGNVEPDQQITVFPKAAGEILSVNYDVGDVIEAGAVLCEIDSKTLRSSIAQMQAAVGSAQAKANYSLAIAQNDLATQEFNTENGYDNTIKSAENAVENAEEALRTAENRRAAADASLRSLRQQLHDFRQDDEYPISMIQIEELGRADQVDDQLRDSVRQAELSAAAADIGVEQAKQNLEQAKEGLKTAKVMSKEQQVSAKTRVQMAELNTNLSDQYIAIQKLQDDLANYTVTSSISGVVESRNVDPYDMVSQQSPLFVIANRNAMTVSFNVSEANLDYIHVGEKITIDKNGTTCTGTVSEISSIVDAKSGLFTIEATVENPPKGLFSGSTVKVFADVQKAENDLLIPIDAIYYENGNPYVYVADNGTARKTFVETGISDEKNIQIVSGITLNDEVIMTWNSNLSDGASIKFSADEEDTHASDVSAAGEE